MGNRVISKNGLLSKYLALTVLLSLLIMIRFLASPKELTGRLVILIFSMLVFAVWWLVFGRIYGLRMSSRGDGLEVCRFINWAKVPFQDFEVKSAGFLTRLYGIYRLEYSSGSFLYMGARHGLRTWVISEREVLTVERGRIVSILEQSSIGGIRISCNEYQP